MGLISAHAGQRDVCAHSSGAEADCNLHETMVHEVGHELGLFGFSWSGSLTSGGLEEMSHPTISDSVMNYWEYGITEPDCSPHPFDIMAFYALYQTVNR